MVTGQVHGDEECPFCTRKSNHQGKRQNQTGTGLNSCKTGKHQGQGPGLKHCSSQGSRETPRRLPMFLSHRSSSLTSWIQGHPAAGRQTPLRTGRRAWQCLQDAGMELSATSALGTPGNTGTCNSHHHRASAILTDPHRGVSQAMSRHPGGKTHQTHKTSRHSCALKHHMPLWQKHTKVSAYLLG